MPTGWQSLLALSDSQGATLHASNLRMSIDCALELRRPWLSEILPWPIAAAWPSPILRRKNNQPRHPAYQFKCRQRDAGPKDVCGVLPATAERRRPEKRMPPPLPVALRQTAAFSFDEALKRTVLPAFTLIVTIRP